MGVIAQLADEMMDQTTVDPSTAETVTIAKMQLYLGIAAHMLRKQEEDYEKFALRMQNPPRLIDCSLPAGSTVMP